MFATEPIPFAVREPLTCPSGPAPAWRSGSRPATPSSCTTSSRRRVPIVGPPVDGPFGRTFSFAGPEGYVITIHDR
ncbi:hypothetical protein [[Actinomadura] parvosata]|uniref:hypothetical protein n=1 Tax=[Actinomadura] parvosata TaxID=1955412 RepID=UPI001E525859|nr:hypothetical protein [Nonomuraea sp. ATCC 55076]